MTISETSDSSLQGAVLHFHDDGEKEWSYRISTSGKGQVFPTKRKYLCYLCLFFWRFFTISTTGFIIIDPSFGEYVLIFQPPNTQI